MILEVLGVSIDHPLRDELLIPVPEKWVQKALPLWPFVSVHQNRICENGVALLSFTADFDATGDEEVSEDLALDVKRQVQ